MKTANFLSHLLLAILISATFSGCKKTPKSPTPIFNKTPGAPGGNNPSGLETPGPTVPAGNETRGNIVPGGTGGDAGPLAPRESLGDYFLDRDIFKQDTVYFAFDRSNVKPSEMSKVQAVANYLKNQSEMKVLVEGHCDERGTPEYNRALGERRALSVRESLVHLGVSGDRIQTLSYGEDRPADPGHSESAWEKNRRGEFVLMKPKGGAPSKPE
jgi:peptidoglycan-associated lipoprotein